jgi:hypothetical protein
MSHVRLNRQLKELLIAGCVFFSVNVTPAQDCYESSIVSPTPFVGNDGEIFKLADGSIWEVKYEYEYLYEYYPDVLICPSRGKLGIGSKMLSVQQIAPGRTTTLKLQPRSAASVESITSRIDGDFEGWDGETIVKLMNGQIWQQTEFYYRYHYSFMPEVLIFRSGGGYKMKVDGIDKSVGVTRLQ